jgi:tRNA threonylcarbamoyladenosine biosynthesis protein TsaB
MMLLAIDTSTRNIGVALYDGDQVVNEMVWANRGNHTVHLAPAIAETLERSGFAAKDLQVLVVALGPGSFTALRIGLALAKGMALPSGLPLVGVPTLDVMAFAQPLQETLLAVMIRAGRGRLGVGWYQPEKDAWRVEGEIEVMTAVELAERIKKPTLVAGELTGEERRLLSRKKKNVILASPAQSLRRPGYLAELGWNRWQKGEVDDPASLAPIYLHPGEPVPG